MAGVAESPSLSAAAHARGTGWRRFAIAPRHVRALLWLRWKLTVRGYTRSWRQLVGLIVMAIYLVPFSLLAAIGTGFLYVWLPRAVATQLLFAVLGVLFIAWAALPLLQYSLNEGLDVTKLQAYPLTRGEQMTSLILSTLLDPTTLVLIGCYVGAFAGWHASLVAGIITAVALVLAYVYTVVFSQLVLAALMGMLRSRRYRDLTIVVFAVFGALCSVSYQLVLRAVNFGSFSVQSLPQIQVAQYFQWLPAGMAARVIVLANAGQYEQMIPWALALLALLPLLLILWARVLDRGITVAESSTGGRPPRRARAAVGGERAAPGSVAVLGGVAKTSQRRGLVSPPARAIAVKDLRYYWRDPQLKAMLLGSLAFLVVIFLPRLYGGSPGGAGGSLFSASEVLFAPIPALYLALNLSMNSLGLERGALQTLYLFPVRPLDVLWGKNLATGAVAIGAQLLVVVALSVITGGWSFAPAALVVGVAGVLVVMGCGNVTSILLPFRMRQMRVGSGNYGQESGCLRAMLGSLVLTLTMALLAPVAAAIAVPLALEHAEWLVATLPASLLYGLLIHQLASRLIAPQLLARAPEILGATSPEA